MECHSYQRLISKLIDGELAAPATQELRDHLAACPECDRMYQQMSAMTRSLESVWTPTPEPGLAGRVKARVADERRAIEQKEGMRSWVRVPLMAMVVLLALGLGNLAGKSMTEIIGSDDAGEALEGIGPDLTQSFADVLIDLGSEENAR